MKQEATGVDWMRVIELVFSWPGAFIVVSLIFFLIFICLIPSEKMRQFVAGWKFRFKNQKGELSVEANSSASKDTGSSPPLLKPPEIRPQDSGSVDFPKTSGETPSLVPDTEVSLRDQMFKAALSDKDSEKLDQIFDKWLKLTDRKSNEDYMDSFRSWLRLKMGIDEAIEELKSQVEKYPKSIYASIDLGEFYKGLASYDIAMKYADTAITRAKLEGQLMQALSLKSNILIATDRSHEAITLLKSQLSGFTEPTSRVTLLEKLADVFDGQSDALRTQLCLEQILIIQPENKGCRFRLAYSYGQGTKTSALAVFHYRLLLEQDPNYSSALNNLGSEYLQLELPGKCISSWKVASTNDAPYPATNLSLQFTEHGFFDEAAEVLQELSEDAKRGDRAIYAATQLARAKRKEDEKIKKLEKATKLFHKLQVLAAEKSREGHNIAEIVSGKWISSDGSALELEQESSEVIQGRLVKKRPQGLFAIGMFGQQSEVITTYNLRLIPADSLLRGTITEIVDKESNRFSTMLAGAPTNQQVLLVMISSSRIQGVFWAQELEPTEVDFSKS